MKNISDFTIFLHGPSGAGKGEVQRKLTAEYEARGYEVMYISSGDLYREAFAKPEIAEVMKRGMYFDTLGAIIPGLQERYADFLRKWQESDGKTVLLLDGLVRRGEFENKDGVAIPSQIEQVAQAFLEVRRSIQPLDDAMLQDSVAETKRSKHLLIDIDPKDAETQMRLRANKELALIRVQLDTIISGGNFPFESTATMYLLIDDLAKLINAEVTTEQEFEQLSVAAKNLRRDISMSTGKSADGSYAAFFREFGVETQLRDDDVSPLARRKRIENYILVQETAEGYNHVPGFAAQALIDGLGYQYTSDGAFESTQENCAVLRNGSSKEVTLASFQAHSEQVSGRLYRETEAARVKMFVDPEVTRKGKER